MKKASELIDQIMANLSIDEHKDSISLFDEWETIAGSRIASHSKVKEIEGDTLIISVDHPGWNQVIQLKKQVLLKEVQKRYPELSIQSLRIILG